MLRLIPLVCLGILLFPKAFARGMQDFEILLNWDPAAAYEAAHKELDEWQDKRPVMDKARIIQHWLMAATRTRQHPDDPILLGRLREFYEKTSLTLPIQERLDFYELYSNYLMLNDGREEALEVAQRFRTEATQNDRPEAIAAALYGLLSLHMGNSAWMNERIRYGNELLEFLKKETRLGEEQRINLQLFLTTNNLYGQKSDQKRLFERSIELALEKGAFRTVAIRLADQALGLMYQESQDTEQIAALLERALETARKEKGHLTESHILGYQAFFFNYDKKFLKALEAARLAIHYTPKSDLESLAEYYREEIVALNGLGRFEEAISKVKDVRRMLPESMNGLMVGIQLFESTAYEHSGDLKSALESYKNFHKIYAEYRDKEADEHYAKASADIGLALESQKTLLLQKDNELQATRLQATHRLWIAAIILTVLLFLAAASLVFSLWQMRLLKLSRSKMKNILGLIEEGIVMIRADFRADGRASRFLQKIYPEWDPRSPKDAIDQLFPPGLVGSEQNSIIRETLRACLGEESLAWDLNEAQLPRELSMPLPSPKLLSFLWQPVFDNSQCIKGFLLAIRDITHNRELEIKLAKEQQRVHRLQSKTQEILSGRFQDSRSFLDRLSGPLDQKYAAAQGAELISFQRELHTFKGEARTLGLKSLSLAIHELESALLKRTEIPCEQAWQNLRDDLQEYLHLFREVLAQPLSSTERHQNLCDIVASIAPGLKQQLHAAGLELKELTARDRIPTWTSELALTIRGLLIHALSNAADHGYILPFQGTGKLPDPEFEVVADYQDSMVFIAVRDRGAGLNLQKIRSLAQERGILLKSDQSVNDLLFHDGWSTVDKLSETSGRGIGLSAIRATCRASGGDATIGNRVDGNGTELKMHLLARDIPLQTAS